MANGNNGIARDLTTRTPAERVPELSRAIEESGADPSKIGTPIGGGGGGGGGLDKTQEEILRRKAREKARKEREKRQREKRKQRQKEQEQRQERIQSGTIGGQLKGQDVIQRRPGESEKAFQSRRREFIRGQQRGFESIKRRPGESKQAFEFRRRQFLRGTAQASPELAGFLQTTERERRRGQSLPAGVREEGVSPGGLAGSVGGQQTRQPQQRQEETGFFDRKIPGLTQAKTFARKGFEFAARQTPLFTISAPGTGIRAGGRQPEEFVEFTGGVGAGFVPETPKEVGTTAASFAIGGGIGAGLRGGGAVLRSQAPRAAPFIEKGIGGAGLGLTGLFVAEKGGKVKEAEGAARKGEVIGETGRDIIGLGAGTVVGSRAAGRGIGFLRTRGKQEVDVIAPEFRAGQTFPRVRKGQTAGELQSEFLQPKLPGETPGIPRGFSARPQPLGRTAEPGERRPGELAGVFVSPDVSPKFFRASGERPSAFGFQEFGGLPTAERITLRGTPLAPGVKPGQAAQRRPFTRLESEAIEQQLKGTGEAVVPFIKTEKEAILGETFVSRPRSRTFTRDPISGERVPIFEREVLPTREFTGFRGGARGRGRRGEVPLSQAVSRPGTSGPAVSPSGLGALGARSSIFGRSKPSRPSRPGISRPADRISDIFREGPSRPPSRPPSIPGGPPSRPSRIGESSFFSQVTPRSSIFGSRADRIFQQTRRPPQRKIKRRAEPKTGEQLATPLLRRTPSLTGEVQASVGIFKTPETSALEILGGVRREEKGRRRFKII